MKKKLLSLLIAIAMIVGLVPNQAYAAERVQGKEQVRVVVENTTFPVSDGAPWDGVLVDSWIDLTSDSTMMSCVVEALEEAGYDQVGAESNYISSINGLAAFDGGDCSGWMGTLNDWFTNYGFGAFTVADGNLSANDEIRIVYTLDYGADVGGTWSNTDTSVSNVEFSEGTLSPAFNKDTYEYTLSVPADTTGVVVTPTASNKNYQVRTSAEGVEYKRPVAVPVKDGSVILVKCGDPEWPSMNSAGEAHEYNFTVEFEKRFEGEGTVESPYLLDSIDDFILLSEKSVDSDFANVYFKITGNVTLPADWTPIGIAKKRFAGTIDGDNHLLTIAEGGKALLGYTKGATLKNLDIYGSKIEGNGVIAYYTTGASGNCATIENVTLKSGTKTLLSGFVGGYASGSYPVVIKNCKVEKDVIIGYDGTKSNIGSFGGDFNGTIENCVSEATVKGVDFVGGISGSKGQSMGDYKLINCTFSGKVIATGNYVGGASGSGYAGTQWGMSSAPNSPCATINGCTITGEIEGANYVGGILGGEGAVYQCWENGIGEMKDNTFSGKVKATAENAYVGAFTGFFAGLNKCNVIEGNKYSSDCGVSVAFGKVAYVDTSFEAHETISGAIYINSGDASTPLPDFKAGNGRWDPTCFTKRNLNRADDPLGADLEKLVKAVKPGSESGSGSGSGSGTGSGSQGGQGEVTPTTTIRVSFTLYGDDIHGEGAAHTLRNGNLKVWIPMVTIEVPEGSKVKDVFDKALADAGAVATNPSGNYVSYITFNGVTLGEFSNGKLSGWMYTLNGTHPLFGVAEQGVKDGDTIVFHYTDDYTKEEGSEKWNSGNSDSGSGSSAGSGSTGSGVAGGSESGAAEGQNGSEIIEIGDTQTPAGAVIAENNDTEFVKVDADANKPQEAAAKVDGKFFDSDGEEIKESFVNTPAGKLVYVDENGEKVKNTIISTVDENTGKSKAYYANKSGVIVKNKLVTLDDGTRIFTTEDGSIATKQFVTAKTGRTYYTNKNGIVVKNKLITVAGKQYYANKYGIILKDKIFTAANGKSFVATADGSIAKSCWVKVDGKKVYCNKYGFITKEK